MRLFLGGPPAETSSWSFSPSLASLLTPAVVVDVLMPVLPLGRGVSGGVEMGTPVTLPEFVAAMPGTLPPIRGGLVKTAAETCVATDEVLFERAGDDGLRLTKEALAGGEGAANEPAEFLC